MLFICRKNCLNSELPHFNTAMHNVDLLFSLLLRKNFNDSLKTWFASFILVPCKKKTYFNC